MAVNSKGHIFVYTRNGSSSGHIIAPQAAQLLEFGPDGKFIKEIGQNLYSKAWAHAVRVDKDDNIWLVDNGSDMVVKLSPDGSRVLLTLGRRRESVAQTEIHPPVPEGTPVRPSREGVFNEPTDVTWDPQGNIFVSDGYKNMEVSKYDKDGNWVKRVGKGNGRSAAASRANSITRTGSRPMPKGISMWRIAATREFRCSIATSTSFA